MFITQEIEIYRILLSFSIGAIAVSAWSLLNLHIPDQPVYNRLRTSRKLLVIDYLAIVLFNTFDLIFLPINNIIPVLFVTIGMFQTMFVGYAMASLISPIEIKWSHMVLQSAGILALFGLNVYVNEFHTDKFPHLVAFTVATYLAQLIYYCLRFFHIYRQTLKRIKDYYAIEEETRMAWVKNNFLALIVLSVFAACNVINQNWFYYIFIISYVPIYTYIAIEFITRCHKYFKVLPTVVEIENKEKEMEEDRRQKELCDYTNGATHYNNFSRIALELDHWVSNKGFLKPDVTIDQILQMLDTTRPTLRAFMNKIYGMTFSQWRNELRLDYAYHLIKKHPEYTIEEITKHAGFADEVNFRYAFRKKYAMSPKEVKMRKEEDL